MKADEEIKDVWDSFLKLKDHYAKAPASNEKKRNAIREQMTPYFNELVEFYYDIAEDIANRMATRLKEITAEECLSYGIDGLYEAIERFDPSMGNMFRTYAPHRIRGAILDNIRKADWVPRLVRYRHGMIEKQRELFFMENGYTATDEEIALRLNMTLEHFNKIADRSIPVCMLNFNTKVANNDTSEETDGMSNVAGEYIDEPIDGMLRQEMFHKLLGNNFTQLERKIVFLHYYEGLTMKEIANQTNFSESRISQMHAEVLNRLRQKIQRNPAYANDLEQIFGASK